MPAYEISSPTNEQIKRLVRLRERRHRDSERVFLVEGQRLVSRAVESGMAPLEVYYDPARIKTELPGALRVARAALDRASYRSDSEGLIAVFPQKTLNLESIHLSGKSLVLMAEGIEKPGNLGAMLRTADAVGADAFVAIDSLTDPFNPNTVRASTGALFTVPLAMADLEGCVRWLEESGLRVLAASPEGDLDMWAADMTGPIALLVGAEAHGLTESAIAAADAHLRIPMLGRMDSLNASVSLALLAYEAVRQSSNWAS